MSQLIAELEKQSPPPVVGSVYRATKNQLLTDEQVLLRLTQFEMVAPQPHKYLLAYAAAANCSRQAARMATCLLNDAITGGPCLVEGRERALAAAALKLAILAADEPSYELEIHRLGVGEEELLLAVQSINTALGRLANLTKTIG